jgi:hypothetical protein
MIVHALDHAMGYTRGAQSVEQPRELLLLAGKGQQAVAENGMIRQKKLRLLRREPDSA